MTLDEALAECPIVAILRGVRPDEILNQAAALHEAGVRVVEIPLNSPEPLEGLRRLADMFGRRMVVGSGTVLTAAQADGVADAGGRLAVAPNTDVAMIRRALTRGLEVAPGFATASEAFTALGAGARRLKLFPASSYGVGHLKQLKAVLPTDATVWAVGGVTPASIGDWADAGAAAFGLGGDLYRPGQDAGETHRKARLAVEAVVRSSGEQ